MDNDVVVVPFPALLTSRAVAKRLSVCVRTLWRLVASGQFPRPVRFNRRLVRWKSSDVDAYLAGACDRAVVKPRPEPGVFVAWA